MVYLFLGQDSLSKDIRLKQIRQEILPKETEQFNLDILYAKELTLKDLQEKLLCLPIKSQKRIVVVKNAQDLGGEIREFVLSYVKAPYKQVILILDIESNLGARSAVTQQGNSNEFVNRLYRYAKIYRFRETKPLDTFALTRFITLKKPDYALKVLNQLFKNGERPERILGGLRYVWEREAASDSESKRRLKLLLNCDMDIKTGRIKPIFALEKLVISLCGPSKPFH
jgi:DNA polymerase III delta subunit